MARLAREREAGEVGFVFAVVVHAAGEVRVVNPEGYGLLLAGEQEGERGAPTSRADHRDVVQRRRAPQEKAGSAPECKRCRLPQ